MAKLGTYYGLCPLIDQRSLLGITEDKSSGHVIVTLGKNIAIKYRLSDQKQILSWRTKDKFTSPVIYDNVRNEYIAVFNQMYIRFWDENEENLDKQKKYKFNKPIYTLIKCEERIYVIFNNGSVCNINKALDNRKELNPENIINTDDEYIGDVLYATVEEQCYIALHIIKNDQQQSYFLWCDCSNDVTEKEVNKINMVLPDADLVGCCFNKTEELTDICLLTLWSNGKLYSYQLTEKEPNEIPQSATSPGHLLTVIESLSCKKNVTLAPLDKHYIAMYGASTNEEGATLNLYNIQFKVTQSRQGFKMFNHGAKLWALESNILLCVGQNLAVIPFHLDTEQLSSLVGSHKLVRQDDDADVAIVNQMHVTSWDDKKESDQNKIVTSEIKPYINELLEQGWSVSGICEDVLPQLIEKRDLNGLSEFIVTFPSMPESCMVKIIKYLINEDKSKFRLDTSSKHDTIPEKLKPYQRCRFIDSILNLSYTDIYIMQHIRKQLSLDETLLLIKYIIYLLEDEHHSLPLIDEVESERKLIDWGNVLLDANYVNFLLTKDEEIFVVLTKFKALVKEHLEGLEHINQVYPILSALKNNHYTTNSKNINLPYSVDLLNLS